MKKRTYIVLYLLIGLIGFLSLAQNGNCYYVYVLEFNVSKTTYYNDETIYVNATYDLDYDPQGEVSFVQLKIDNTTSDLLWESPTYPQIGTNIFREWYIKISELSLPFNNSVNIIYIHFYYYFNRGFDFEDFIDTKTVQLMKRNISCELIGFNPNVKHGDPIQFQARFFYPENNSNLINHVINVKVKSKELILFNQNFTTNSSGLIEVIIPSITNLTIGYIDLVFTVFEGIYHLSSSFQYQISLSSPAITSNNPNSESSTKTKKNHNESLLLVISIVSMSSVVLLFLYYMQNRNKKEIKAENMTFKY